MKTSKKKSNTDLGNLFRRIKLGQVVISRMMESYTHIYIAVINQETNRKESYLFQKKAYLFNQNEWFGKAK